MIACQLVGAIRFVAMRRALLAGGSMVQGVVGPIAMVVHVTLLAVGLLIFLMLA